MPSATKLGLGLFVAILAFFGYMSVRISHPYVPMGSPTVAAPTPALPAEAPPSAWRVSRSRNDLTGDVEITAVAASLTESLIVRQRGKQLDCYVSTGEFLETVTNMDSRGTSVRYRFDDAPIVKQTWTISDSNTGLFYPGNPTAFLRKMRKAKRFVIEYAPADKIPQTASFDVSGFPPDFESVSKEPAPPQPDQANRIAALDYMKAALERQKGLIGEGKTETAMSELHQTVRVLDCIQRQITTLNQQFPEHPLAGISDIRQEIGGNSAQYDGPCPPTPPSN